MRRLLPFAPWLVLPGFVLLVMTIASPAPFDILAVFMLLPLWAALTLTNWLPRKCGHGRVSQSRLGLIYWPYPLRICPHCKAREW